MHILIVKTSSLGDIIQSFSAVATVKKYYPKAKIDWIAEKSFCGLLKAHPDVERVIPIEVRKWKRSLLKSRIEIRSAIKRLRMQKYDLLFDLQGSIKSGLITCFARAQKKIGYTFFSAPEWPSSLFLSNRYAINTKDPIALQYLSLIQKHLDLPSEPIHEKVQLKITSEESFWIKEQIKGLSKPLFMVCPGAHWENKKLSLKTWERFLTKLQEKYTPFFFFVWGNEKEKEETQRLHGRFPHSSHVLPKMTLPVWQHFMDRMDVVLTVDSAALHLAGTTSTSTFSIFGPSKASVYKPLGSAHHAFQGFCHYSMLFDKRCPILRRCKTGSCLKEISPETLANRFFKIEW